MVSEKGNDIPNQFKIITPQGIYFQSYSSIIAFVDNNNNVFLDEDYWNYSRTTSKYRNIFLKENTEQTKYSIKTGEYELTELN